ncbi:MAG: hypothetical protein MI892_22870, partial [Desulfobacterales bacterium]|nr:hypothetical protein [Desulfobacterales bacterium]
EQFRHQEHLPMSHTMLNREMFVKKPFMEGVIPCTYASRILSLDEWKKASSISGMRTKLTRTTDEGLKEYGKALMQTQKPYLTLQHAGKTENLKFLDRGGDYILDRLAGLGVLKAALLHWLDVKKEQVTSKRRPAILQLLQSVTQEEEALSGLMDVITHYHEQAVEIGLT